MLPAALTTYAGACVTSGDFNRAADCSNNPTRSPLRPGLHRTAPSRPISPLAAEMEQQGRQLAHDTIREATARGEGSEVAVVLFSLAVLHNGLGQYEDALAACTSALEYDDVGMFGHLLNEMVEAAARSGNTGIAETAAAQLISAPRQPELRRTGVLCGAKALLTIGPAAEDEYRTAIEELEHSPLAVLTARTRLLFGEWLRRTNRRAEAGDQLRIAYDYFLRMGADGFAERTRRELQAAGGPNEGFRATSRW